MTRAIKKLCVIGTGLIGGSFCLAMKRGGLCQHIIGAGRSEQTLMSAKSLGIIDDYSLDISEAVESADLVFVSVPLGAMEAVFEQIEAGIQRSGNTALVITDGGSSKAQVQALANRIFQHNENFVPGHPIAGTEKSGPSAAFAELYDDRRVILTPDAGTSADALTLVTSLWQQIGAEVETMDAGHHDKVLAATSHLPHVLAYALVDCMQNMEDIEEIFQFAAGGFRDFSRIASSDPVMWRDICMNNSQQILEMMQRYRAELDLIYNALHEGDADKLLEIFRHAKQTRDNFIH